jgi:hypothetical protein
MLELNKTLTLCLQTCNDFYFDPSCAIFPTPTPHTITGSELMGLEDRRKTSSELPALLLC